MPAANYSSNREMIAKIFEGLGLGALVEVGIWECIAIKLSRKQLNMNDTKKH